MAPMLITCDIGILKFFAKYWLDFPHSDGCNVVLLARVHFEIIVCYKLKELERVLVMYIIVSIAVNSFRKFIT